MSDKVVYYFIYWFYYILACLPLSFLFFLSDLLFCPVYYCIRYRRKLVRKNLTASFPEKTKLEIISIEKAFYRHLCDYFFESLKLLHISDEEMRRRFVFKNIDLVEKWMKTGNSFLMTLGHYGNWEWVTSISMWVDREDKVIGQVYRPLKNKAFDRFFLKMRSRFHTVNIAKNDTLREIVKVRRSGGKMLIGFISDQKPSPNNSHYWTEFLNQETSILTGAERIAKQAGFVVGYLDVTRVKRGYYEGEIRLIAEDPKNTAEFEITERYARMMEATILRTPAYWLWSHNRWKHKRPING